MEFKDTGIKDLLIITPVIHKDPRGYFSETYKQESFLRYGISFNPLQDNESRSSRGVIRGLHYQLSPYSQAKLVRVIEGSIFDVALDLRKNSATFGRWFGIELNDVNRCQLFIPRGFAHGFSVLSDHAVIQYKIDNIYNPSAERGISVIDPVLGIDWKVDRSAMLLSDKDIKNPTLAEAEHNF